MQKATYILYILLLFTFNESFSQINVKDGIYVDVSINVDSLFTKLELPKPDSILLRNFIVNEFKINEEEFDIKEFYSFNQIFLCKFTVKIDTVVLKSFKIMPFDDINNEIDTVWKDLAIKIKESSKNWRLKPLIHDLSDLDDKKYKELSEYYRSENDKILRGDAKAYRPFVGVQTHFATIRYNFVNMSISHQYYTPQFFYWIENVVD